MLGLFYERMHSKLTHKTREKKTIATHEILSRTNSHYEAQIHFTSTLLKKSNDINPLDQRTENLFKNEIKKQVEDEEGEENEKINK